MKLVLIEGPGKKESVTKYLGKGYKVLPTFGHVIDLPVKKLGVDINNNFEPEYIEIADKKKVINGLRAEAKKSEEVLIATDPDREGEAIAWHIAQVLGIDPTSKCRISFNEITEKAVQAGLKEPREIDQNLVDAQQARRVLDRLVGYKLSPILCKKVQSNLSAGRVQSVTLRLVVERDREIDNFKPEEYYTLSCMVKKQVGDTEPFKTNLVISKNKRISSKDDMDNIVKEVQASDIVVKSVKKSVTKSHPYAPFTTSTMQQDAGNKLGYSLKITSQIAQGLYEGVDVVGEGKLALVTYIRTDSVRVSPDFQLKTKSFIEEKFGKSFVPEKFNFYKSKKDAQDAHEAIRPIYLERTPESLKDKIGKNYYRLYKLIYDRFLASQMSEATYNSLSVEIEAGKQKFKTTGRTPIFAGFTKLYENIENNDEDDSVMLLPELTENEKLNLVEVKPEQKFTKPQPRFTETSLLHMMEEKGIGRPSTYPQLVNVLYTRAYVEKKSRYIESTLLGKTVVDLLIKYFEKIMDVGFTADMEDKLDGIEFGGKVWQDVIRDFYTDFEGEVKNAMGDGYKSKLPEEVSDIKCEKCGAMMVYRNGRFGKFLACPNFPTCKNTKQILDIVAVCPKCGGNVVRKRTKNGKFFYGCDKYPTCDYISWEQPANKKCEKCGEEMIVKTSETTKSIICPKCHFTIREKIENKNNEIKTPTEEKDGE
ncbi:MAG: type I DNA topoisomerase [Clostridia bacterium]